MKSSSFIFLSDALLIGKGGHRDVYINPENSKQVIKINARAQTDHWREMKYRKSRQRRRLPKSSLLTDYYGSVKTNLGTGYIFERIIDFDGESSKTIEELIELELKARKENTSVKKILGTEKEIPLVSEVLFKFREVLFKENIIIPDMGAFNYMVQFDTLTDWRVRIVDDIGSPTLIPIVYWVDFLGARHVRRRWNKFIREIMDLHPGFLTREESSKLIVTE